MGLHFISYAIVIANCAHTHTHTRTHAHTHLLAEEFGHFSELVRVLLLHLLHPPLHLFPCHLLLGFAEGALKRGEGTVRRRSGWVNGREEVNMEDGCVWLCIYR